MIGIIKSDNRYKELSKVVDAIYSDKLIDFYDIDTLILPIKGIDNDGNILINLNLEDIIKNNSIKKIITGKSNNRLKEICKDNSIKLIELFSDPSFVKDNARLTALGIFSYLLDNKKLDKPITIIGFGNISFYLALILSLNKIKFNIYTLNPIEIKFIELLGYNYIDNIYESNLLINTIPKNLDWDYQLINNKYILDVSSAPYGFDILKLDKSNKYEILSNIPAIFYPYEAMKLILTRI